MPRIIADLHIHSKYSRATSREMDAALLNQWAKVKGIDLLGTGDFTHPVYFSDLQKKLESAGNGLFRLKKEADSVHFMLTAEVNTIFTDRGKTRRVHTLIFAPSFQTAGQISSSLSKWGKIASDGRPILKLSVKQLAQIVLNTSDSCMLIPAHIWTPWYSLLGDKTGYRSIEEAFGEWTTYIHAVETGLSSDPDMNWRVPFLDGITLISNSDAHSPSKLGREANIFDCEMDYHTIAEILRNNDRKRFLKTIEFFPEKGKYHYDGHRNCHVLFSPAETKSHQGNCPVCGKRVTVGVMHRVDELAERPENYSQKNRVPFVRLVPLQEIIAEALGIGPNATGVTRQYHQLIEKGKTEFSILLDLSREELAEFVPPRILEGILNVRSRNISIRPGYDGLYGEVRLFEK